MRSFFAIGSALLALAALSACGKPDQQALQKLACQQAAASLDLQSVSQLDTLRKALGLAPDVDPLGTCRDLGVNMKPDASGLNNESKSEGNQDKSGN